MYRLPSDPEDRERWIKAIPRDNIPDNPETVVCAKHFPAGFEVVKVKGRSDKYIIKKSYNYFR